MRKLGNPRIIIASAMPDCWIGSGEEAVIVAMLHDLRQAIPNLEATVVTNNSPGYLRRYGVQEVLHRDIRAIERAARDSDLAILAGGEVFRDRVTAEGLAFHSAFALMAALIGTPLMIYGAGIGPLKTETGQVLTRLASDLASLITVRDEDSRRTLEQLGVARERIEIGADPAFSLPVANLASGIVDSHFGAQARPALGVALGAIADDGAGIQPIDLAAALDNILTSEGGAAVFFLFRRFPGATTCPGEPLSDRGARADESG